MEHDLTNSEVCSLQARVVAMLKGLELCFKYNLKLVDVLIDCNALVEMINQADLVTAWRLVIASNIQAVLLIKITFLGCCKVKQCSLMDTSFSLNWFRAKSRDFVENFAEIWNHIVEA